jgi:plastocyanin
MRAMAVMWLLVWTTAVGGQTTQPARGVIEGRITSPGEIPLSEMVIFLDHAPAGDDNAVQAPQQNGDQSREAVKVSQKGARFDPPLVIITVGQGVEFLNDEDRPVEHNVFSNAPAKRFDLGLYPPGESKTVVFDKPGAVFLYCSIHRFMDGVIYVTPTPYFSRASEAGTYRIDNVPPGEWIVKTWQRRRRFPELSIPVRVGEGETKSVELELKRP